MKKVLTVLPLCAALVFMSGCATAFKTEKAADVTVSAAMTAWGNYVAQYHPPVAQELQVRAAFQKYQQAEILAVDASKSLFDLTATNAPASATAAAQTQVTQATQAAALALSDLVSLLQTFGVAVK